MTAQLGEGSTDGRGRSPDQLALLKEIEAKIDELKSVEGRLGTSSELPADLDRARELAHKLNNLLTAYKLTSDLNESG
jgi:hypothetical protein